MISLAMHDKRANIKRLANEAIARGDHDGLYELLGRFIDDTGQEDLSAAIAAIADTASESAIEKLDSAATTLLADIYVDLDAEDLTAAELARESELVRCAIVLFAQTDATPVNANACEACGDGVVELRGPGVGGRFPLLACYAVRAEGALERMSDACAQARDEEYEAEAMQPGSRSHSGRPTGAVS